MSGRRADRATNHWAGVGTVALLVGGVGVLVRQPALLLVGAVGLVYAGYANAARPPPTERADGRPTLQLRRTLDEASPDPGDEVTVTTTVRNASDAFLPDVRVVDGVPAELEVVEGSPRIATSLRAGKAASFRYVVTATRGEHRWTPAQVVLADPSAAVERETSVESADATTLRCVPPLLSTGDLPLRGLTSQYAGRVGTDVGGSGVEFFATREYRRGDPRNRIDWNRLARTGDLSTLEFRVERAATVVLLVDARKAAYRAPEPGARHAVERSVDAAGRTLAALLDGGDRVGIAVFGPEEAWLAPGTGDRHRAHARDLLANHELLSSVPPEEGLYETFREDRREELLRRRVDRFRRRLPGDAQVFAFSPCCDNYMPRVVRHLDAQGHLVTLVSPDPTADDTPGRRLARMDREDRIRALRGEGLRVIDWRSGDPVEAAVARAQERWSR